jgi:hypothetical protein
MPMLLLSILTWQEDVLANKLERYKELLILEFDQLSQE